MGPGILGGNTGGNWASSFMTTYGTFFGGVDSTVVHANVRQVLAVGGTASNLQIKISQAPGSGNQWKLTLCKNGSATGVTCTISGSSATACSDASHTASFSAGDTISMEIDPSSEPIGAAMSWSVQYQ